MAKKSDLLQGTLDLLVLKTPAHKPLHGYAIAQRILVSSPQVLDVQQGLLYPAMHRLERKGFISSARFSPQAESPSAPHSCSDSIQLGGRHGSTRRRRSRKGAAAPEP